VTKPTSSRPPRPDIQVLPADSTIDLRAWARLYVATLLRLEGVHVTPTAIAEAGQREDNERGEGE
jgi:hypothetical protein